jgi:hypothetical protein
MKRNVLPGGSKRQHFAFRPAFRTSGEAITRYLADVCALSFGQRLTRREARRLAFRLLADETVRDTYLQQTVLDDKTKSELLCLANAFLADHAL